jgi:hypothetical protein
VRVEYYEHTGGARVEVAWERISGGAVWRAEYFDNRKLSGSPVVAAGANTVSEVTFTVEDPEALVDEARGEALKNAAARADQMAEGLGLVLGSPVLVMETSGGGPMPLGIGGGGEVMGAAAPSISPGSLSVSVSVQIVYEIQ